MCPDVVLLAYDINGKILDGFPMELTDYTEADETRGLPMQATAPPTPKS